MDSTTSSEPEQPLFYKPTPKQLAYLRLLGYDGPAPVSIMAATDLIEKLKARRKAKRSGMSTGETESDSLSIDIPPRILGLDGKAVPHGK